MWPRVSPLLTQSVCRWGRRRGPGDTIIPAADSSGFHRQHALDAQHVPKPPQVAGDFINYTNVSYYVGR